MIKQTHRTLHAETLRHAQGGALSLLPLKIVLIAAEKESPARPPRALSAPPDPNEQLALQLIYRIKHHHQISFAGLKIEPPQPLFVERLSEMAGTHAG